MFLVILFIPFIYSYFYLKAYWNPYGKGNIDNLPVAIVNKDNGDKGELLINGIKDSKKLKLSVVSPSRAEDGLYDGTYYAVITIPNDFTKSINSVSEKNKKHATITYSPNQKSNYLSSQIINTVVLNVEKNLDNEINSKIIGSLSNSLKDIPNNLDVISSGFNKLSDGTNKLKSGSNQIVSGSNELFTSYSKFNNGVNDVDKAITKLENGSNKLDNGLESLKNELSQIDLSGLDALQNSISYLNDNETKFDSELESYNTLVDIAINNPNYLNYSMNTLHNINPTIPDSNLTLKEYIINNIELVNISSTKIKTGVNKLNESINDDSSPINLLKIKFSELSSGIDALKNGSSELSSGILKLRLGTNTLNNSSEQIFNGINSLNTANGVLNNGISTLNNSLIDARGELLSKAENAKNDISKIETLEEYGKEPINVKTKEVNKINSYGTAFSPLFICVGLWVGCLMLFMVMYYDKEERFGIFGINDKRYIKKTLSYHGAITLSAIVLGFMLDMLLDFDITNYILYYFAFILIGNVFMAIIEFLITNFKDIGKFIALILLILQLAASAGTFPIETVSKEFRWLNNYLPMTYSIRLLKESLVKIESILLTKSLIILIIIFVVFFAMNILRDILKQKKNLE